MLPAMFTRCAARALATALVFGCAGAYADEGGTPFWTSGQFASLAAVPPSPGWSVSVTPSYYSGNAGPNLMTIGDALTVGTHSTTATLSVQPGYAPSANFLGGAPFLALAFGLAGNHVRSDLAVSQSGVERDHFESIVGGTDLYPWASLGWVSGNNNWMAYLTGDIPTGAYQSARTANIGIGHAAIDAGVGYTYLDAAPGGEFSAVAGLTYNWQNPHTDYRNGVDAHLDWAASYFPSRAWELGVAGYVYYQLTGDSGSGAKLGAFKSRVAALGPEVVYQFAVGRNQWSLNVRAYWEFWAANRLEGYAVFADLNIPLGGAGK